jgi:hypothetical protein
VQQKYCEKDCTAAVGTRRAESQQRGRNRCLFNKMSNSQFNFKLAISGGGVCRHLVYVSKKDFKGAILNKPCPWEGGYGFNFAKVT